MKAIRSLLSCLVVSLAASGCDSGAPAPSAGSSLPAGSPVAPEGHAGGGPRPLPRAAPLASQATADVVSARRPADAAPSQPDIVYRPDDDRPRHDDAALERRGIHRFSSRRLVLYSDTPPAAVESLPALVDALYEEWTSYFGELPPARDGSDFQITGYVMADAERFAAAGLLPEDLPDFAHGRHRGRRFWMRDQQHDYYRRHLLLHEATHCFMTLLPGSDGPVWYMEGMAEHFATHRAGAEPAFRVMPDSPDGFAGLGRITLVRQAIASGEFKTLDEVFALRPEEYLDPTAYGWSWAACYFLDTHPGYRDRFREMGNPRSRIRLDDEYERRFSDDQRELAAGWARFAHTLRYGYDLEHATVAFQPGGPLEPAGVTIRIRADAGWQSTGLRIEAGSKYHISAEGRFTLAETPVPWVSDANGISFDYFDGRPLGRLLAAVVVDDTANAPDPARGLLSPIDLGRIVLLEAPRDGTLYLRLNDGWDRLADNRGEVSVSIRPAAD